MGKPRKHRNQTGGSRIEHTTLTLQWGEAHELLRMLSYTHNFAAMHQDATLSEDSKEFAERVASRMGVTVSFNR